ncbi:DUF1835 domain-containing protein [Paenibacillus terrigena]|uniref:DUF1835 domain-containing protein n=1 Tax=Paenibacillus terrigena TaxID=369333 RepID=UPI0028D331FF|nr:DUF1835 domain-containing protein [Paenibacillus terrigena]
MLRDIRQSIQELPSEEVRTILFHMMLAIERAKQDQTVRDHLYSDLLEMYEELLISTNVIQQQAISPHCRHVHLAFSESSAGSLRYAIKKLGWDAHHQVIAFHDDFTIGPVWQMHEEQGRLNRREWFRNHINEDEAPDDDEDQYNRLMQQISQIPEQASITIWGSDNAHEQVGMRYAVYLLRDHPNDIVMQDAAKACDRLFNRPEARVDYKHTGAISPDKLLTVLEGDYGTPISMDVRSTLEQEWLEIADRPEVLRIYEAGHICHVSSDYFDAYMLEKVENLHEQFGHHDFIKAARVVGEALGYCDQYVNDTYFEYRLRELVYQGELEILGIPRAMRYYRVRRSGHHDRERKSSARLPL